MKSDLITIFNQLTSSELADYNLFYNIIENHYEKFKYLYSLIDDIDLSTVDKINCKDEDDVLSICIQVDKVKYLNDIVYIINSNKKSYVFADYFIVDLIQDRNKLHMTISVKSGMKEDDIYANRFI